MAASTEQNRATIAARQQQQDQRHQEGRQQEAGPQTAKSGQLVRAHRSSARREEAAAREKHRGKDHHHDRDVKHQHQVEDLDNRLAIQRQNDAIRANRITQQNALENSEEIEAPVGGFAEAALDRVLGKGSQDADGALARTDGTEDDGIKLRVTQPEGAAQTDPAAAQAASTGLSEAVDIAAELNLAELSSTPTRYGGTVAMDNSRREQMKNFIDFLTSTFQKTKEDADPFEEAFSRMRWAVMLKAIADEAQKFILESATKGGFSPEIIRKMVANALRVLDEMDIADADFVALVEEQLDSSLAEQGGVAEQEGYKIEFEDEDESRRKQEAA